MMCGAYVRFDTISCLYYGLLKAEDNLPLDEKRYGALVRQLILVTDLNMTSIIIRKINVR